MLGVWSWRRPCFFLNPDLSPCIVRSRQNRIVFGCCVRKKIRIEWMGQAWYMLATPSPSSMATYCTSSPTCLTIFPLLSSLQPVCQDPPLHWLLSLLRAFSPSPQVLLLLISQHCILHHFTLDLPDASLPSPRPVMPLPPASSLTITIPDQNSAFRSVLSTNWPTAFYLQMKDKKHRRFGFGTDSLN